ncbi:MAG: alpha/beta hydrolase [Elusimicrobiaceae bacterium]|nr:alpha/beta hydrolase [Elusimicrobiaceae bacterium]
MRKFLLLLVFAILTPLCFAQSEVEWKTADNWNIKATFLPSKNGKMVILLHDLGRTREDYKNFTKRLENETFGYLAFDLRGHGKSTNLGTYNGFKKTGTDNEYNQMVRDVEGAINFLNNKGYKTEDIFIIGAGLGANVAAKAVGLNPQIAGLGLLTPGLKTKDVLSMGGIKMYKNPVMIAVGSVDRKPMMEANLLRNAAFLSSGQGKVLFLTAYELAGTKMLDRYLTSNVIWWLKEPALPEVLPDIPNFKENKEIEITYSENKEEEEIIHLGTPSVL